MRMDRKNLKLKYGKRMSNGEIFHQKSLLYCGSHFSTASITRRLSELHKSNRVHQKHYCDEMADRDTLNGGQRDKKNLSSVCRFVRWELLTLEKSFFFILSFKEKDNKSWRNSNSVQFCVKYNCSRFLDAVNKKSVLKLAVRSIDIAFTVKHMNSNLLKLCGLFQIRANIYK